MRYSCMKGASVNWTYENRYQRHQRLTGPGNSKSDQYYMNQHPAQHLPLLPEQADKRRISQQLNQTSEGGTRGIKGQSRLSSSSSSPPPEANAEANGSGRGESGSSSAKPSSMGSCVDTAPGAPPPASLRRL